ncbi:MAG: methyltransferase domain-containing protein [Rhodospirillales bacterium]|nr:methyltransferase domain-containing protein [Rhodospirillales bacterium]
MEFTTRDEVKNVYERRAAWYDLTANLYYLLGFREQAYRRRAAEALAVGPGDAVVEIGCGTGLNFALIERRIGAGGRLIGVDLTQAMLDGARRRVVANDWRNVELVCTPAAEFRFPAQVDAVLSTFALTLEPDFEAVIAEAARALKPGGRFVLLDLKIPDGWLGRLAPLLLPLVRPFAVSMAVARRQPWRAMERHFAQVRRSGLYFGIAYLAVGVR